MEQIERRIFLTQQIMLIHRRPDQIIATQQVEGESEETAVEIALRACQCFDHLQLLLVNEVQQFAATTEIDLRGKEGRASHLRGLPLCGKDS